jgi:hypothetical protein
LAAQYRNHNLVASNLKIEAADSSETSRKLRWSIMVKVSKLHKALDAELREQTARKKQK